MPTQVGAPELVAQGSQLPPQQAVAGPMSPEAEAASAAAAGQQPAPVQPAPTAAPTPAPAPAPAPAAEAPPAAPPQVPPDHMVTVFAPNGKRGEIPATDLHKALGIDPEADAKAVAAGKKPDHSDRFQLAYPIITPDGKKGYVPAADYTDSIKNKGFKPVTPADLVDARSRGAFGSYFDQTLAMIPGIYHSIMDGPQNDAEQKVYDNATMNHSQGNAALLAYRVAIAPAKAQYQAAQNSNLSDTERLGHGVATAIPIIGPWVASAAQTAAQQAGAGNWAGATGTALGAGTMAALPKIDEGLRHVVNKIEPGAMDMVRGQAQSMSGADRAITEAQRAADATYKAGVEAARKNNEATREAHVFKMQDQGEGDTVGAESPEALPTGEHGTPATDYTRYAYSDRANAATSAADAATAADAQDLADWHSDRTAELEQHRLDTIRVGEENRALEESLDLRRRTEQAIQDTTDEIDAKQNATKAVVKADNDFNWNTLRKKMTAPIQLESIQAKINEWKERLGSKNSPTFESILKAATPERDLDALRADALADLKEQQRQFLLRKDVPVPAKAIENFVPNNATYETLTPDQRAKIDDYVDGQALVEGVDADTENAVSFARLQGWYTEIGHQIANDPGMLPTLKGALEAVQYEIQKVRKSAAAAQGASEDLSRALGSHIKYKEAFGYDRPDFKTVEHNALSKANPEWRANKDQQDRINALAVHEPSIKDAYDKLAALQKKLKGIPSEDALRSKLQQMPEVPPEKPLPKPNKVRGAGDTTARKLKPVDTSAVPSDVNAAKARGLSPIEQPPSPEFVNAHDERVKALQNMAYRWKALDKWQLRKIAGGVMGGVVGFALSHFVPGGTAHIGGYLLGAGGIATAMRESLPLLAGKYMNKPGVIEWLAKTPEDEAHILEDPRIPEEDRTHVKVVLAKVAIEKQQQAYAAAREAANQARRDAWDAHGNLQDAARAGEAAFTKTWADQQVKLSATVQKLLGKDLTTRIYKAGFSSALASQAQRDASTSPRRYDHTAVNPKTGHRIGTDDGTNWFDVNTGHQTHVAVPGVEKQ